jgi:xanthine dehydrogenase accessory factor
MPALHLLIPSVSKLEKQLCNLLEQGEAFVLASILSQTGSTPRLAGTKMVIRQDGGIIGTIGGGWVEAQVMAAAPEIFQTRQSQIQTFQLNAKTADTLDMICGGSLEVLLEFTEPSPETLKIYQTVCQLQKREKLLMTAILHMEPENRIRIGRCLIAGNQVIHGNFPFPQSLLASLTEQMQGRRFPALIPGEKEKFFIEPVSVPGTVWIFGAGHVSQQVAILTRMTDFQTIVLDDRSEFANPERFPMADDIRVLGGFENAFSDLNIDEESYIVILTRGHSHDKTVLAQALRTHAGYIGMIGSHRKRDAIYKALLKEGFTEADLKRVYSPIGLDIGAETPAEIAVSISGELIQARARNLLRQ